MALSDYKDPLDRFFAFARERHSVYLKRKAGAHWPWTEDEILQNFRFTNVFREYDKTTVWLRENIRDRWRDDPRVFFATAAFRWFNRIETGMALHSEDLFYNWNPKRAAEIVRELPVAVTGAFIVRSPDGMTKVDGVVHCIQNVWSERDEWEGTLLPLARKGVSFTTLQQLTDRLALYPMMGKFMAYEVACDMRYTAFYENAPDICTWANPGPGARRGMQRLQGIDNPKQNAHKVKQGRRLENEKQLLEVMQQLLRLSRLEGYWPLEWQQWEMREVEHTLCEFDKYERVRLGQGTPRSRYTYADYRSYLPAGWRTENAGVDS